MVFCISDAVASDLSTVLYGGIGKVRKTLENRQPNGCAQKKIGWGLKDRREPRANVLATARSNQSDERRSGSNARAL